MSLEPLSLLLIEDDPADAVLVQRSLDACGNRWNFVHATTLSDGVEQLEDRDFAVLMIDLSLPDAFMLEGVTQLRQLFPAMPVIVLTNLADHQLALETLDLGVQDYLIKGHIEPEQLERTLHYAMQRQQLAVENQRLMAELERLVRTDPLTGLLNRHHLDLELDREWSRSQRTTRPLSCVLLDVDFFKRINDQHGHAVGDGVLRELSRKLETQSRTVDRAARYGGEEFCVLLPETTEAEAADWAERLRAAVESEPLQVGDRHVEMTISIGVAAHDPTLSSPDEMIELADQALRIAKQLGRNQVVRYSDVARYDSGTAAGDESDPFAGATALDVMTPIVVPLVEEHSLLVAVRFLLMLRADSLPVVDDRGQLTGLITEEDLLTRALTGAGWTGTIAEAMNRRPVCYEASTPARIITEFLSRVAVRRVLVVRNGRPIGMISRHALIRWYRNRLIAENRGASISVSDYGVPVELRTLVDQMVIESTELQVALQDRESPVGAVLVSKASQLQSIIDEALGLLPVGGDGIGQSDRTLGQLLG